MISASHRVPRRRGRRLLFVLAACAQVACGGAAGPPVPAHVRSSPVVATPTEARIASVVTADFSCRLPVSGYGFAPGGFVSFPDGGYAAESADRLPGTPRMPDLGLSYDAQVQRWLPVRRQQVSPDGRTYAYVSFTYQPDGTGASDGVHVMDGATGRERLRIANRPAPALPWFVAGFDAQGIYLSGRDVWSGGHPQSSPEGLALADPRTGRVRPITDSGSWISTGGGAAWGMDAPLGYASYGVGSKLLRLDLSNGSQQTWLTESADVQLLGVDGAGHPLVELDSVSAGRTIEQPKLWIVTGPDQTVELRPPNGTDPPEVGPAGSVLEDGHGIWITPEQAELRFSCSSIRPSPAPRSRTSRSSSTSRPPTSRTARPSSSCRPGYRVRDEWRGRWQRSREDRVCRLRGEGPERRAERLRDQLLTPSHVDPGWHEHSRDRLTGVARRGAGGASDA